MLLFLIGYMGCGKSTIGRKLRSLRGYELVDTDSMIEQREGMSVGEIFEMHGEEHFRKLERDLLGELALCGGDCIVSTGGGLPLWGDNMERMNSVGDTIYICRTAENIASRLSANGRYRRPKLRGLSDEELVSYMGDNIAQRDPIYRTAKLTIDAVPLSDTQILSIITDYIDNKR